MRLIDPKQAYEIARLNYSDFALSLADLTSLRELFEDCDTVEVPRWIPVTERLPTDEDANEYGYVLGFDKNENYAIWHKSHFENHPEWFTHWTNLLDAPKDGDT